MDDQKKILKNSEEIFQETQKLLQSVDSSLLSSLERYGLDWLLNDPSLYLEKFGKHLTSDLLEKFREISKADYEVSYYLEKYLNPHNKQTLQNRRFAKLNQLLKESEYFSMECLMEREPDLVKAFLGRRFSAPFAVKSSLTEILLEKLEEKKEADPLLLLDKLDELDCSKPIGSIDSCMSNTDGAFGDFTGESVDNDLVTLEKLKKELLTYCKERFMSGKDENIDYLAIDEDDKLDCILDSDLENEYFSDSQISHLHKKVLQFKPEGVEDDYDY